MSKLTLTAQDVEFAAQGVTDTFNLSTAAPLAIEGIIAYGIRRWSIMAASRGKTDPRFLACFVRFAYHFRLATSPLGHLPV